VRFASADSLGLVLALSASLAGGCTRRATQLLVEVGSDLPASRLSCVHVEVSPLDDPSDVTSATFHVALADREPHVQVPFSFGVTPPGGQISRRVEVRARAHGLDACSSETFSDTGFVERRVRTGWLADQALRLPIFLSADCLGITCSEAETCDAGRCVPVPDVDPGNLVITTPMDDAGVSTPSSTFAATRPMPVLEVARGPTLNLHDALYPVGASGGDRVLVAGALTADVVLGATRVPAGDGIVFLASLPTTPGASPDWVATLDPAVDTYPVIERAITMPNGDVVLCGTASAPFVVEGRTFAGGAAHHAFVGAIGPDGRPRPDSFHSLDADPSTTMGTASPQARCVDLALASATELVAAVRTWNAASPRVDSGTRATRGVFLDTAQNLLLYRVASADGGLAVSDPIVVGHHATTMSMDALGFAGASFAVETLEDATVLAAEADDLAHDGTARTSTGPVEVRVRRVGSWLLDPLVRTSPVIESHLEALALSPTYAWVAVTIQLDAMPRANVAFGSLAPFEVTRDATYLVRIDLASGDVVGSTVLPEDLSAAFEDNTGAATSEDNQLYGGAFATTGRDEALYATAAIAGDHFGDTTLDVTGSPIAQADPFLGIVGADGAPLAAWQWTDSPEHADWRLTHVTWIPSGFVAVAGYVESTGTESSPDRAWRRERSFFEILPAR
jgi:hypothetical protein